MMMIDEPVTIINVLRLGIVFCEVVTSTPGKS